MRKKADRRRTEKHSSVCNRGYDWDGRCLRHDRLPPEGSIEHGHDARASSSKHRIAKNSDLPTVEGHRERNARRGDDTAGDDNHSWPAARTMLSPKKRPIVMRTEKAA